MDSDSIPSVGATWLVLCFNAVIMAFKGGRDGASGDEICIYLQSLYSAVVLLGAIRFVSLISLSY